MKNRKIVFFDIDGTLLPMGKPVPDSTIKAIELLKENGHIPALCTGRAKSMLFDDVLFMDFPAIVAGAGTYCEYNNKILINRILDSEIVDKTMNILRDNNLLIVGEGPEYFYMEKSTKMGYINKKYDDLFRAKAPERVKDVDFGEMRVNKFTSRVIEDSNVDNAISQLSDMYNVINHGGQLLELVPRPFSKAEGMKVMMEKLGFNKQDTIAFGDSGNDIEMLQFADIGVAMGNSSQAAIDAADMITDDILEDGIYKGLEKLGLI